MTSKDPRSLRVVALPTGATSMEFARKTEQELMDRLRCDVIVTSDNIRFCKIEPVDRREVESMLKVVPA